MKRVDTPVKVTQSNSIFSMELIRTIGVVVMIVIQTITCLHLMGII